LKRNLHYFSNITQTPVKVAQSWPYFKQFDF